jgi:hypothetical protein
MTDMYRFAEVTYTSGPRRWDRVYHVGPALPGVFAAEDVPAVLRSRPGALCVRWRDQSGVVDERGVVDLWRCNSLYLDACVVGADGDIWPLREDVLTEVENDHTKAVRAGTAATWTEETC